MPNSQLVTEGRTIVVRGLFNPLIFQPQWLRSEGLVTEADLHPDQLAEEEAHTILTSDVVQFDGSWFQLQVTRDRFVLSLSESDRYDLGRDLVVDAFERLRHTPVVAVGLNTHVHYSMPSSTSWDQLGVTLAPRKNWEDVLEKPGMKSLTVQAVRPDNHQGSIFVRVEPSEKVVTGVFIEVNDHYQLATTPASDSVHLLLPLLSDEWAATSVRAASIITHTLDLVK